MKNKWLRGNNSVNIPGMIMDIGTALSHTAIYL